MDSKIILLSEYEGVASSSTEVVYEPAEHVSEKVAYDAIKKAVDFLFSLLVCIILFIPALILCAIIAFEVRDNPIYTQTRVGRYGKPFKLIKFRSMVRDAHNVDKYFTPQQKETWLREQKVDNDPRITRIGRFIRKTSIDEFPQFLNVLAGQMSIVGPRPITEDELDQFGPWRNRYLSVKPGITGWWQVGERNSATFENGTRQKIELYYVDNRSLKLDTQIFFKTFAAIVKETGQ